MGLEVKIENSYEYGQNRPGCKAVTYERDKLIQGRPAGGWAAVLTDEQVAAMAQPLPILVIANLASDPEVPQDVTDHDDPLAEFQETDEPFWYGIADFAALKDVREYIVEDWLIAHGITAILAKRGTGKSTLALDLACHIAHDLDWLGRSTMTDWCVIYICGEDHQGMILNTQAWLKIYNEEHPDAKVVLDNDRFMVAKGIIKMTNKSTLGIRLKQMVKWARGRRCLIVLDTWARATSGSDVSAGEEMSTAYDNAEMVAKTLKGPMVACFHPPKGKAGALTITGSHVQEDATSGIWLLEKARDKPGTLVLWIERSKGAGERNYARFRVDQVDLPTTDEHGNPLTGIVAKCFANASGWGATESDTPEEGRADRVDIVTAALVACGGDERHVTTKVLATKIVADRLEQDADLRKKTKASGTEETLVKSEERQLRRHAEDRKVAGKVVEGILAHLVVSKGAGANTLWRVILDVPQSTEDVPQSTE